MHQIILAIQTPRAGKWNHRWIIPAGSSVDDTMLTTALAQFDSLQSGAIHRNGIVFHRSVEQETSGRTAREFVFLYCPDFSYGVSTHGKSECYKALESFFNSELAQLVTSIDWNNTDGAMVYQSSALKTLYEKLQQEIEQNWEESKSPDEPVKPKGGCFRFVIRSLLVFVTLLAILFYAGRTEIRKLWERNPAPSNPTEGTNPNGSETENGNGNETPPTSNPATGFSMPEEDFKEWSKLFDFPEESDAQKRGTMVREAVNATYTYYFGGAPQDSQTNLSDGSFTKTLFELRNQSLTVQNKSIMIFSENHNEIDAGQWRDFTNVAPVTFREKLNSIGNVHDAVHDMAKLCNQEFPVELDNLLPEIQWSGNQYPNFFFASTKLGKSDIEMVEMVKQYIAQVDEKMKDVLDNCSAQDDGTDARKAYKTWIDFKNQFNSWFPEH